jgi:hypothetical protein
MDAIEEAGSPETVEISDSRDAEPSPRSSGAGTVRRMSPLKAGLISAAIGLAIAGGVFAGFGWPGSLDPAHSNSRYGVTAAVDEELHVGLGPFHPGGPREIKITAVSLVDPSPAIQLASIRITRFDDAVKVPLGSDKGPREDIEGLPEAVGIVLEPGEDGGFWVSFRVTATGTHSFKGIRVTYRSGWLTRTVVVGPSTQVRVGEARGPRGGQGGGRTPRTSATATPS